MASLKELRKRISSIKSTAQITRAMKMVAAAKLKKAENSIKSLRPYAYNLKEIIANLAAKTDRNDFPLLAERQEIRNIMLLIITSDKGLCGAFNSNISKTAEDFINKNTKKYETIKLAIIGKKGKGYFEHRNFKIHRFYEDILGEPSLEKAELIGNDIIKDFISQKLDAIYMIYNEYKSPIKQDVVVEQLLPIVPLSVDKISNPVDYIYEPSREDVLNHILPLDINIQLYRSFLESVAAEMGARMTAMENATNNAKEKIDELTLMYNKLRQAAITKELMEIISGVEALKG